MKKSVKLLNLMAVLIVGIIAASGLVSAAMTITDVELDDDSLGSGANLIRDVQRGDEFQVKIHVVSDQDISDVQAEAYIRGYDHDDIMDDVTDVFDMKAGVTYVKKLTLQLRDRMDQDRYQLRVRVEGRDGASAYNDYDLEVDAGNHEMVIKDLIISPENEVVAGRALLVSARLKNYGEKTEDSVKVKVSIPELDISASDYVDEVESDDSTTTEELYLRIPVDAKSGEYQVLFEVEYDDGDETAEKEATIYIVGDESASSSSGSSSSGTTEQKTIITIGPDVQDVRKGGAGVVYPVTIANTASVSKAYTLSVEGANWGTFRISPSNVLVAGPGETQSAYIFVSAKDDADVVESTFSVKISSNGKVLQNAPLKANVLEAGNASSSSGLKKGLEVGLVVLVILLVILGLIIGFNKLKGEEEPADEDTKTYY